MQDYQHTTLEADVQRLIQVNRQLNKNLLSMLNRQSRINTILEFIKHCVELAAVAGLMAYGLVEWTSQL